MTQSNLAPSKSFIIKSRGRIEVGKILNSLKFKDTSFIYEQKLGYNLSYISDEYQFHVVDRFASFPLYYAMVNGQLHVSDAVSELTSFIDKVEFDAIGYASIGGQWSNIRTQNTPIKGIFRLLPGHYLKYENKKIFIIKYWSFTDFNNSDFKGSFGEAAEELGYLIRTSVKKHLDLSESNAMHLSGGQDSGVIASLVCQFSNQENFAYVRARNKEIISKGIWECNIVHQFSNHYPNLKTIYAFELESAIHKNFNEIDNWFGITNQDIQNRIAHNVSSKKMKYILTGLGGDEIASYGFAFQNYAYFINMDWQAKLHLASKIKIKNNASKLLKLLNNDKAEFSDSIKYLHPLYDGENRNFWYCKNHIRECRKIFSIPLSNPIIYPASREYRLKLLDRSFFTYRSDLWNYMGKKFGVDYLHPLLEVDLVQFCTSLPSKFFKNQDHRALFKTALKSHIPEDLLVGGKRPVFGVNEEKFILNDLMQNTIHLLNMSSEMSTTFAASVYDFKKIETSLKILHGKLSTVRPNQFYRLGMFKSVLTNLNEVFYKHATYLNKFF